MNRTAAQSKHTHGGEGRAAAGERFPACSIADRRGCVGQWAWQSEETSQAQCHSLFFVRLWLSSSRALIHHTSGPFEGDDVSLRAHAQWGQQRLCVFTRCPSASSPQPRDQPTGKSPWKTWELTLRCEWPERFTKRGHVLVRASHRKRLTERTPQM